MKNKIALISIITVLTACSDTDTSVSTDKNSASNQALGSSCIVDYIDKPCELLTAELIKVDFPLLPDQVEKQEVLQLQSCAYIWPSDGRISTMKVAGKEMEIPVSNEIGIKWIRQKGGDNALQYFRNAYHTPTEEEKASAAAAMDRALEERSGELTQGQKSMASGMTKGFMNEMKFESLDNIGTAAAWGGGAGPIASSLKVLDNDTEFEIVANISADDAINKALASDIAKSVIASCK